MIYLQLFVSYLKIGFFGFGGGYAMLSLIQNEVVVQHAWMSNAEFADIVAVSQMTPGPIAINSATYVGYTVGCQAGTGCWCGILGSVIATFAVCLPSLTVMLLLTRFFLKLKGNRYIEGAMAGMKPVVIGMIAAAALLIASNPGSGTIMSLVENAWGIFGASFGPVIVLSLFWRGFTFSGAAAGIVAGAVVDVLWLVLFKSTGVYEIVPGFAAGLLAAVIASKCSSAERSGSEMPILSSAY